MKRLLTLAAMFLCCMATTFAQFSGSGSGTESDPYLILNPIQLNQLRNYLNQSGVYFKVMANIDLTEFLEDENPSQGWQPIGTTSTPFKGILDGNGKTISGLWINRSSSDYVGLFGCTNGATIKNLNLKGISVKGNTYVSLLTAHSTSTTISNIILSASLSGDSYVGGCVGWGNSNTISNVSSTIEVTSSGDYAGGIIGYTEGSGSISESRVTCNSVSGANYVGGICGANRGTIPFTTCHVEANVIGGDYVGGVVGQIDNTDTHMTSCNFCGDIKGSSYVGGVCGRYASSATMKGCYAVAHVLASGNKVGGLVGETHDINHQSRYVTLLNNYFSGSVSGAEEVGGLIGHAHNGKTKYCYANTKVSGKKSIGGLIGKTEGYNVTYYVELISNVAICSSVKATEGSVGRIFGEKGNYVTIGEMGTANENKAWNRAIVINAGVAQDITDDAQNGSGVSKTTLKLKATYVAMGWDFTDVWAIQETECYPYMKSQTAPPVILSQVVSGATTVSGKCVDGGTVTLEIDGVKQQMVSSGNTFSFTVSPLQAGHEVRVSAKADGKEQSYLTTEVVSFLGKGTESDPYQISTAADLTQVYRKGYYKQMNDIDLTNYINQFNPSEGWESIGREGSETIHFDGDGHKITGLWCNSTRDNTGLFSCFANGTIKNLTVVTSSGKQVKGGTNTGVLIGKMINGTIENCRVSGNVVDGTPVGGIVGLMDGGKISLSQANVTINTTLGTSYVGGLVGEITGGEIDQCVTQGTITATGQESYVGGLVGKNYATVTNSYSNATVTSPYNAAGLIAYNYDVVDKCYATGDIFSNNYGAGVIGYNDGENAVVKNCVAMNNKIDVTYESQQVQQGGGYGQRIIGGIKNSAPAPELNNYALKTMQVSLNNVPQKVYDDIMNGVGKTGADLMKKTTYQSIGWDFTDTWSISESESYPSLKNNEASVISGDNSDDDTGVNTLFGSDLQTSPGTVATLPVILTNEDEVKLCQFDLRLPTGVTVATKSNGKLNATLTGRAENHSVTGKLLDNGDYRFVISSMDNDSFTGNDGTLLNITLDISATMEAGEYSVKVLNVELSVPDGTDLKVVKPADTESKLTIKSYTPGDVNNDGSVSVTDVGCAINYILEQVPSVFIFDAADMNGDKAISVTDVGMIINLILSGEAASSRGIAEINEKSISPSISLRPTTEGYELLLENKDGFIGIQFDVQLADGAQLNGMQLTSDSEHLVTYRKLDNGKYRVICYSPSNSTFAADASSLLTIATNSDVDISDIRLTTTSFNELRIGNVSGETTGIADRLVGQNTEVKVYSLDGRLLRIISEKTGENPLQGLQPGIYMIGNRKVIVK